MHYLTAGASHGKQLSTIIEGMPARMPLAGDDINHSLLRRQKGYDRGKRMEIEKDLVDNQFSKLKEIIADYRYETRWFY